MDARESELCRALLDTYLTRDDFEELLADIDLNLNSIVGPSVNLRITVRQVVRRAKGEGWLGAVEAAALLDKPDSPALKRWHQEHCAERPQAVPAVSAPVSQTGMAPLAPEVAELAGQLAARPDALDIIYEVFDRTLAVAPPGADVPSLLMRLHELVRPRGEAPLLQQVRELAAQRASGAVQAAGVAPEVVRTDPPVGDLGLLVAIREDDYDPKTLRLWLTLFQDRQPGQPQECGNPSGKAGSTTLRSRAPMSLPPTPTERTRSRCA